MKFLPHAATLALGLFGLAGCDTKPAPGDQVALGEYVYVNNCQPCHAPDGSGNPANAAPGISGLPDWYVAEQLRKFKDGRRGAHFDDIAGMRMRPMARTLDTEDQLLAVSAHVAAMPHQRLEAAHLAGDADAGKKAFAACAACHGADGAGNKALNAPPLKDQDAWYVHTQLLHFKSGVRGAAKGDVTGSQMAPNVAALDEKALLDLASYIDTL